MADLAQCFHWQPSELKAMPIDEAMMWHAEAILRNTPQKE
jgi:hypothetical protein